MSSVIWTALRSGVDREATTVFHEGKKLSVNSAPYGYEKAVNFMLEMLKSLEAVPAQAILVFEGMNSKAPRLAIDPTYKANRSKDHFKYYENFAEIRARLSEVFRSVGSIAVTHDEVEGDDMLGWLAENIEEDLVVVSGDNDLQVLHGINSHGAKIVPIIGGAMPKNPYGDFPAKYITLYKALVGDSSDGIKGVPGFGKKSWEYFWQTFGERGSDYLIGLIQAGDLGPLFPDSQKSDFVKKLYDNGSTLIRCYRLALIHPEWCDTLWHRPRWEPGIVLDTCTDERFRPFMQKKHMVLKDNFQKFLPWLISQVKVSPFVALDIETSTPSESDDWLAAQGDPDGVDVIGSVLTGMSLTFGRGGQHTVYMPVDHTQTANLTSAQVLEVVKAISDLEKPLVIHNTMFEGPVLYQEWGETLKAHPSSADWNGFLPRWLDTKLEAAYVDENSEKGLKFLSRRWLGYKQTDYATTTTLEWTEEPPLPGGRFKGSSLVGEEMRSVSRTQYKMRELPASHVFDYACDDTICTWALHNFFTVHMGLDHHHHVYRDVELRSAYLHAQSFVDGFDFSIEKMVELARLDDATFEHAKAILDAYLISKGWEGSLPPDVSQPFSPAMAKEVYRIVTGTPLVTQMRIPAKIAALVEAEGHKLLAQCLLEWADGNSTAVKELVAQRFTAAPVLNTGSPKQLGELLYEVMGAPPLRNKPTEAMRLAGKPGNYQTDDLAIQYALRDVQEPEAVEALKALKLMKMVETRRGLYYNTYPYFVHWKTGKIHSTHNQAATNTRRASSSKPNMQQQPKHPKVEGQPSRFRETVIPHHRRALVVSMDFVAQELRVITDYSQDPNMLACYVGDNLRDMHILTGLGIMRSEGYDWSYEAFAEALEYQTGDAFKLAKKYRALGKKVNFTTEYGAMAPKLAATMLVSESVAQTYIDAREETFSVAKDWKQQVILEARTNGFVRTKLGAKRHLAELLLSPDRYVSSKAERQAVNTKIQSSSAEMTKLAEGRMWDAKLRSRFDCRIIGPIHDEVVSSVAYKDLFEFCKVKHGCMARQYADMTVPVLSSISFGPSFGIQIEVGEQPTEDAIAEGLAVCVDRGFIQIKHLQEDLTAEQFQNVQSKLESILQARAAKAAKAAESEQSKVTSCP